jgi:transcriptional regulator with XRE-family HTH domain
MVVLAAAVYLSRMARPRTKPRNLLAHLTPWREKAGLTQEQVANIFDVHPVTVSRWETGELPVDLPKLKRLADLFGAEHHSQLLFPPSDAVTIARLRRAHDVLVNMTEEQAARWLGTGEDVTKPKAPKT